MTTLVLFTAGDIAMRTVQVLPLTTHVGRSTPPRTAPWATPSALSATIAAATAMPALDNRATVLPQTTESRTLTTANRSCQQAVTRIVAQPPAARLLAGRRVQESARLLARGGRLL